MTNPEINQSDPINSLENKTQDELKDLINKIDTNDVNSMVDVAKGLGQKSIIDKLDNDTIKSFVNKVAEKGEPVSMTEMAKSFGQKSLINKLDNEAVKSFVNKVAEKGEPVSMTEMAKSLEEKSLADKLDGATVKSFVNKALDSKFVECLNKISNNQNVMNKLDEATKSKINAETISADEYLENNLK